MDRYDLLFDRPAGAWRTAPPSQTYNKYEHQVMFAAHNAFSRALASGRWYRLWARVRRRSIHLHSLYATTGRRPLLLRRMNGVQMVLLSRIQGTEGKRSEFDRAFRPLHERSRGRWVSVAVARALGQNLPPVDLIRLGDVYFVRDGHHRISVARAHGQQEIEANILVSQSSLTRVPAQVRAARNVLSQKSALVFSTTDSA